MKTKRVHSTSVVIEDAGVMITGKSGFGKSDLALRLIDSGATLISDDVVKMVMMEDVVVKKKSELFLQPGGKHLMLFEITKKLNDGDSFDLQVNLKNGNELNTKVMVLNKKLKSNFLK